MLYTRLLITLLAVATIAARPQDIDALADELAEIPDDLISVDGPLGPAACDPADGKAIGDTGCNNGEDCKKRCVPTAYCYGTGSLSSRICKAYCTVDTACAATEYCKNPGATTGTCTTGCRANGLITTATATQCPTSSTHIAPVACRDHVCTYSTCTDTGAKACTAGTCTAAADGVKTCVIPTCTVDTTCAATEYCKKTGSSATGTCTTGCRADGLITTATATQCPTDTTHLAPVTCDNHVCKYTPPVVIPPVVTKCNAYKKCANGFYCHNKECKAGCDKKYSACKKSNGDKGTCDGSHTCVKYDAKKTGAPCKRKSDCKPDYKCVRDPGHGYESHCHAAVGATKSCNTGSALFQDVCKDGLVCNKSHKCEEHKKKKNKYD